jgi:exonuclease SbcD
MFSQRLEERRSWLRRGFAAAVEYALERQAHFFLQAGDLFDTPEPRNLERQFVAEALAKLRAAGVRCLGIGGNHDTSRARGGRRLSMPHSTYAILGGLRLLGEGAVPLNPNLIGCGRATRAPSRALDTLIDSELFDVEGVRIAIGGIAPDPTLPAGSDPLEGLEWRPDADISLLMLHGSLEGHVYPGAPEPIVRRQTVETLEGVQYLLVGHVHRYAAFCWADKTVIVPGATERMTFGEQEARPGFVYLELEAGRTVELRHVPVECQPRQQLEIHTRDIADGDPAELVIDRLRGVCDREAMVRVILQGPISRQRYHDLKLRELAAYGSAHSFFFDLDTTGLYVEDEQRPAVAGGIRLSQRDELIRFARESWEAADSPEERALIEEALTVVLEGYQ